MELAQLIRTKHSEKPSAAETLDILFASSEVAPYSKTGGLADVAASLPKALNAMGHRVSIITPLYKHLDPEALHLSRRLQPLQVPRLGKLRKKVEATIWEGRTEGGVRIFFIQQDDFFGQNDNLYGYGDGDLQSNPARFAFFSRAIVEFSMQYSVPVDVIHCNDWHTALAPIFREHYYAEEMKDTACVLTIHNLAFQGRFDGEAMPETGLPKKYYAASEMRVDDAINYLKGGIKYASQVTTVSPTYAEEIQSDEGGFGLGEALRDASAKLTGILNGADYSVWSPSVDHYIDVQYDSDDLHGKRKNKAALQAHFGLPDRPTLPLLAMVGRLTEQKGLDLLLPALETLLDGFEHEKDSFQVVFLGEGEQKYADEITRLVEKFPRHIAAHLGYSEELAHKFQAAADILLIPSRFEPCGLTQLYAMRYGTLPLVHATGGLKDTVIDPKRDKKTGDIIEGSTGFAFEKFDVDTLRETIARATTRYRNHRQWRPVIQNAMERDFSWGNSASQYVDIYKKALGRPVEVKAAEKTEEKKASPKKKSAAKKTSKKSSSKKSTKKADSKATAKTDSAKKETTKKSAKKSEPKSSAKKDSTKKEGAKKKGATRRVPKKDDAKK
ncbi:glycogen synthase GlgA [Bradymonas sediminis]|uniref:Glycogen synthase n=1 Tax=Bradymonas sediminis TaxID=1548548 RepID=A0A2Z4FJH4_9DELT|nr:glycogen synthase GlgA [Bradymonas sediminis]AWV89083.1 glycogen synthase GlgA [Bradymonas sediminis]TDP64453.1 glycogen synthase (ADP-glucose) [Bradymonas sediminis]